MGGYYSLPTLLSPQQQQQQQYKHHQTSPIPNAGNEVHIVALDCETLGPSSAFHDMPAFGATYMRDISNPYLFACKEPVLETSALFLLPFDMDRSSEATMHKFWLNRGRFPHLEERLLGWKKLVDDNGITRSSAAFGFADWLLQVELNTFRCTGGASSPKIVSDNTIFDCSLISDLLTVESARMKLDYRRVFHADATTASFVYGPAPINVPDAFRCLFTDLIDHDRPMGELKRRLGIRMPPGYTDHDHDPQMDSKCTAYAYCMMRRAQILRSHGFDLSNGVYAAQEVAHSMLRPDAPMVVPIYSRKGVKHCVSVPQVEAAMLGYNPQRVIKHARYYQQGGKSSDSISSISRSTSNIEGAGRRLTSGVMFGQ